MENVKKFWQKNKVKIIVAVGFGVLFAVIFSKLNRNTFVENDDTNFAEIISQFPTLIDYLSNRLATWSSRILPELFTYIFTPLSVNYWRVVSFAAYGLSAFLGYKLYKVLSPSVNNKKDSIFLALIMASPLLMSLSVLDNYGAVYWFTGAMNYLWMTPFFLAALYLPTYLFMNKKLPNKVWMVVSIATTIVTTVSHEQFGMALVAILLFTMLLSVVKKRKKYLWLIILLLIAIAGFSIHLLAPGNGIRLIEETAKWLPNMYEVPIAVRLESDIRWFTDAVVNQTGYLLPIIWALLGVLLLKSSKKLVNVLLAIILFVSTILGLFAEKIMLITIFLREFYPVWGFVGSSKDWIPIFIQLAIMVVTIVAMWLVAKGDRAKALAPIVLLVTALGTIAAICISPTMYASNHRTIFVASILLVAIIVVLLNRILSSSKSLR